MNGNFYGTKITNCFSFFHKAQHSTYFYLFVLEQNEKLNQITLSCLTNVLRFRLKIELPGMLAKNLFFSNERVMSYDFISETAA